jgi:hypothetical protein
VTSLAAPDSRSGRWEPGADVGAGLRLVAAVALVVGLLSLASPPVAGAEPRLTTNPSFGPPGASTAVSGCGWAAGEVVEFRWDGELSLGSARPDPATDGCIAATLTVPLDTAPGDHDLSAAQSDRSVTSTFFVTGPDGELEEGLLEPQRATWFSTPRLYPHEGFPDGALRRAHRRASHLKPVWKSKDLVAIEHGPPGGAPLPFDASALSAWGSLGPAPLCSTDPGECDVPSAPYSGRITGIAPHPDDAATIFVGTEGGGVWRTTNGGASWKPLFDHMATMRIGSVAIDPLDHDRILAGTGTVGLGGGYLGLGVFASEDAGEHWTRLGGNALDGCAIDRMAIHPQIPGVIVLATSTPPAYAAAPDSPCKGGVYASVDGGKSWKRWLERPTATDVAISGNKVFAGIEHEGVYVSSILQRANGGAALQKGWTQVGGGLPTSDVGRVRVAVAPTNANRLYAVMTDPVKSEIKGGWTSGNAGVSWRPINAPDAGGGFLSLAVAPQSPTHLYLGVTRLYQSLDGGTSFANESDGGASEIHVDVPALAFDALGRLLVGTDGGMYRTTDFDQFANLNGNLSTALIYPGISGSLAGDGPVLAGMQDHGTGLYSGSALWHEVGFGGDGGYTAVDPRDTDVLYRTANKVSSVDKSLDGGHTFLVPSPSHPEWALEAGFLSPVVMDLERPDRIYVGTLKRLFRSPNGGNSWNAISPTIGPLTAIAPAPSDSGVVYAGTSSGTVWVTADGGLGWTDTTANGLPGRYVTDLAVNPKDAAEAWATFSGFGSGHVFHTDDYGATWTDISGYLPDAPVHAIAIDERRSPPTVFAGTDVGVLVSFTNGAHWAKTGGGLPNAVVTDLLMDRTAKRLLAATYGRGLWAAEVQTVHLTVTPSEAQAAKKAWLEHAEALSSTSSPPP